MSGRSASCFCCSDILEDKVSRVSSSSGLRERKHRRFNGLMTAGNRPLQIQEFMNRVFIASDTNNWKIIVVDHH